MNAREYEAILLRPAEAVTPEGLSVRAILCALLRGDLAPVVPKGAAFGGTGLCKGRQV
jgi:hypothetical protein